MSDPPQKRRKPSRLHRLVACLSRPGFYPHRPKKVETIETHSAWVFLAGSLVYKIKKPVRLGFLDFSSLERRRHVCEQEVVLNRRLCPDMYLGVLPIMRRAGGGFCWEGPGRVTEYAVLMKRLAPGGFLDVLLDRGRAGPADLDRVARRLERFYRAHPSRHETAQWGRIPKLRISLEENFSQAAAFVHHTLSAATMMAVRDYSRQFMRRGRNLLNRRVAEGWIRDCHGDLHMEHVHLTRQAVRIFDCIEFNDRFRHIDVASDAAFLAMDLDRHGRHDLARRFLKHLAATLRDPDLMRLADFYKCYRAFVRGKVESLQMERLHAGAQARRLHADRARACFQLALRYALLGSEPVAVAFMGRVGAGKSHLARMLGDLLGCRVVASDQVRKDLAGLQADRRPGRKVRARLYAPDMTRRTYGALARAATKELRAGRCVLLDATYGAESNRQEIRRQVARSGGRMLFVEALASRTTRRERLRQRADRSGIVSDAREEDLAMLDAAYHAPAVRGMGGLLRCRCEGAAEEVLARLLRKLVRRAVDAAMEDRSGDGKASATR